MADLPDLTLPVTADDLVARVNEVENEASDSGTSVTSIAGSVDTAANLPAAAPEDQAYVAEDTKHLWAWDGTAWVDLGTVQGPAGSDAQVTDANVAAALSDDSRAVVEPWIDARTGNGARPVGHGELVISVSDYGATGNGTTDDTAALQAAVDAAVATQTADGVYVAVWFPPGDYYVTEQITIPSTSGFALVGAGKNATRIFSFGTFDQSSGDALVAFTYAAGSHQQQVSGIHFDAKDAGVSGLEVSTEWLFDIRDVRAYGGLRSSNTAGLELGGIHINRAKHVSIYNSDFHNGNSAGVLVHNRGGGDGITGKFVLNNVFMEEQVNGILVKSFVEHMTVVDSYFAQINTLWNFGGDTNAGYAIGIFADILQLVVSGCSFTNVDYSVRIFATNANHRIHDIHDNIFHDPRKMAVCTDGNSPTFAGIRVRGNIFTASTTPPGFVAGSPLPAGNEVAPESYPYPTYIYLTKLWQAHAWVDDNVFSDPNDLDRWQVVMNKGSGFNTGSVRVSRNAYKGVGAEGAYYNSTDLGHADVDTSAP